jgi:hypothetical protein
MPRVVSPAARLRHRACGWDSRRPAAFEVCAAMAPSLGVWPRLRVSSCCSSQLVRSMQKLPRCLPCAPRTSPRRRSPSSPSRGLAEAFGRGAVWEQAVDLMADSGCLLPGGCAARCASSAQRSNRSAQRPTRSAQRPTRSAQRPTLRLRSAACGPSASPTRSTAP